MESGDLVTAEFEIKDGSEFDGKQIRNLGLPEGVLVILCRAGSKEFVPRADTVLHGHMRIVVATSSATGLRELKDKDIVVAVVRVPNSITPAQTATIQALLPRRRGRSLELHVRSLLTKETTVSGYQHELEPKAPPVEQIEGVEGQIIDPRPASEGDTATPPSEGRP